MSEVGVEEKDEHEKDQHEKDERDDEYELNQTKRRLRKALALAEKFKDKYLLELKVSSELARRCDELKTQCREDRSLVSEMERELSLLKLELASRRDSPAATRGILNGAAHDTASNCAAPIRYPLCCGDSFETCASSSLDIHIPLQGVPQEFSARSLDSFDDDESIGRSELHRTASLSILSEDLAAIAAGAAGAAATASATSSASNTVTPRPSPATGALAREPALKLFECFLIVGASAEVGEETLHLSSNCLLLRPISLG